MMSQYVARRMRGPARLALGVGGVLVISAALLMFSDAAWLRLVAGLVPIIIGGIGLYIGAIIGNEENCPACRVTIPMEDVHRAGIHMVYGFMSGVTPMAVTVLAVTTELEEPQPDWVVMVVLLALGERRLPYQLTLHLRADSVDERSRFGWHVVHILGGIPGEEPSLNATPTEQGFNVSGTAPYYVDAGESTMVASV